MVTPFLQAAFVFLAVAVADVCWVRWTTAASKGQRWVAAWWAAAIYIVGSITVIEYTTNHWMIIPAVLGSFCGTAFGVKKAT